jgi:hypothetical protein
MVREPFDPALQAGKMLAVAFAEAGLLWTATLLALEAMRLIPRAGLLVGLVLLTLVPITANRRIALTFREEALFTPTAFARFQQRTDPRGEYRTMGASHYRPRSGLEDVPGMAEEIEYSRRDWSQYTPALWQRGTVFNEDFDSGDLSRLQSLRRLSFVAASFSDAEAIFGGLALRWGIRFRDQEPLPGYRRFHGDALMDWDEHQRAFPDIRLAAKWREESGAVAALNALPRLGDGEIVVESGSSTAGSARPGRLRVLEKTPERVRLEAFAPDPTWLFLLRGHWSHRTVLLDGAVTEDVPAQLAFSAVRVPAGQHRIDWKEEFPGWSISRFGPLLSVLTFLWIRQKSPRATRGGTTSVSAEFARRRSSAFSRCALRTLLSGRGPGFSSPNFTGAIPCSSTILSRRLSDAYARDAPSGPPDLGGRPSLPTRNGPCIPSARSLSLLFPVRVRLFPPTGRAPGSECSPADMASPEPEPDGASRTFSRARPSRRLLRTAIRRGAPALIIWNRSPGPLPRAVVFSVS